MSQYNLPNFASPQPGSTFLKDNLEPWRDAVHSGHMGNTRPDYVVPGMWWIDNATTPWVAKVFQGSDDIIVGSLDPTTLVFTPSSVSQAAADISVDNSGFTVFGGDDVQQVLGEVDTFAASSGSAAFEDVGTAIGDVVQLENVGGNPGLPAVDGSQLTGLAIVQQVRATTTTPSLTTSHIPFDNTIPQNTEGAEVMTLAITPTNASNVLVIEFDCPVVDTGSLASFVSTLFKDSDADALSVSVVGNSSTYIRSSRIKYIMTAGTTSEITFKIRYGANTGTAYFLQYAGGARFGSVQQATFTITEMKA